MGCTRASSLFTALTVLAATGLQPPPAGAAAPAAPQAGHVDRKLASIGVRRLVQPLRRPDSLTRPPAGFRLRPRQAIAIAAKNPKVRGERAKYGRLRARVYTRGIDGWQVSWFAQGAERAQAYVDDRSGRVTEAWTGAAVGVMMARGYGGAFGGPLNDPWLWVALCVLFVLPFVDPRRPLRLLHLDLLVLLSFGISQVFFNHANLDVSVPLVYPTLGYLLVRLLLAGFGYARPSGPLVPFARSSWLAAGIVLLLVFRVGLNVVDSNVIDVGYAGVIGADRITHGQQLYDGSFPQIRGDTYAPLNYVAYVPFELAFPWSGRYDGLPAAHAAAIAFDLLVLLALVLLGRRLLQGREGRLLGLALGYAWVSFPYSALTLQSNANDSLMAALLAFALLAFASPAGRGALIGAGGAVKFAPLAVGPLFAGGRGLRVALVAGAAMVIVLVASVLPFLPHGGLSEVYRRTIGYQASRSSPFSVWGLAPALHPLQTVVKAGALALALALALVPRRRTPEQVAALGAAVIIAFELAATHWFYIYAVWFAPLAFVALFAPSLRQGREWRAT